MNESLKLQLKTLSTEPGVYQFFDAEDRYLYIGKAKNLRKRVRSYFQKKDHTGKIRMMVSRINRLETIVVPTEYDALLLESNMIKQHQPKYNSMLKDDKSYPWICIKNEAFPRIFLTRKVIKDGSQYFGPFMNVTVARTLLELIRTIYPIRNCRLDLRPKKIEKGNYKVCLEYHLGNCLGPCEEKQCEADYNENLKAIKEMIKGNFSFATRALESQMNLYTEQLAFEKAQAIKDKLEILAKYQARSVVVNPKIHNVDVFGYTDDKDYAYINYMKVYNGAIVHSYTSEVKKKLEEETAEEILEYAIVHLRETFRSMAEDIYIPFPLETEFPKIKITVPKVGDKKHIVDLSTVNAKKYRIEKLKQIKIADPERHKNRIMAEMQKDLRMPVEPRHIEGFDNSNLQGTNPASVCVVFRDGKPSKKEYRTYNIKTVEGPDDYASMEEVIYRRYKRLMEEGQDLPQLIVIDGGKGQLSAAMKSLNTLGLDHKISVIGIAKRLEEIYFPNDSIPLYLNKKSESLKVIQQVRDEAHRFSVRHHRTRRSNSSFSSELEKIKGIGPASQKDLLRKFKSVRRIKNSSEAELSEVVGLHKAKLIKDYFRNN